MSKPPASNDANQKSSSIAVRLVVLLLVIVTAVTLAYFFRSELSLEALAARETSLRQAASRQPVLAYATYFVIYVVVTGLSLPGAAALSITGGWLLGFWPALVLTSFASSTGASCAFLLSRYLLGTMVQQRFASQLEKFNEALDREGAWYLLSLRLIPAVPFFVINLVMGLTKMRLTTFWWVSQLGMFPATVVFVLAGASSPSLRDISRQGIGSLLSPTLIVALVLLGTLPLLLKWIVSRLISSRSPSPKQ